MRRTFGIGMAVAALALATGCGGKPTTAPEPPPSLAGGWTLVGVEAKGVKQTEADLAKKPLADRKIRATADKLIATDDGKEDATSYKLDATKTPHEIDMTETKADGKTETSYGIYKLEGDILTICMVPSNNPADRPKEFKIGPGGKEQILTLKKD
jgi:uncharacterized protein (TIGR03067 family)